jgi:hypothetical protein
MKIRSIRLNDVRRFTAPVLIDGIGDGINVLCEPNEHGKSTVFDAVQALCFQPHRSQAKEVRALKPHAGGAPEVAMEVETEGGVFRIEKRWLSRAKAEVRQGGRLIAQADEAEAWIDRLVGGGDGSPSGLLWVRQGATLFDKAEQAASLATRRDLLSSVTSRR